MKKKLSILVMAGIISASMGITSLAGMWQQGAAGWWYDNGDGTWPVNTWQWIDGKCYYFGAEGYRLTDTVTPDGFTVNAQGEWAVDGVVQTLAPEVQNGTNENQEIGWQQDSSGWRYYLKSGYVTSQWRKIEKQKYYFDENSFMVTGFQEIDGYQYYFKEDGSLQTKTFLQDGIYYVMEDSDGIITDEVDEDSWYEYRRDHEISSKDVDKSTVDERDLGTDVTEEQAHRKILSLKSSYPEGKRWTNSNTYSSGGRNGGGCAAFAFLAQDKAFGKGQKYTINDSLDWDGLRVGDHLRIENNLGSEHSVVILERQDDYIKVVEGNYNSSIHWGRKITCDELSDIFIYQETAY